MIERIENAIQLAVLLLCVLICVYRAIREKSRAWTLLAFFFGSQVAGDLYWLLCLISFGDTPPISLVSDLNWFAAYLFLYMIIRQVAPPETAREKRLLPWLGFVFTLGMAAFYFSFYIDWNDNPGEHYVLWARALNNLCYGMLMGLLLFSAIRRLMDARIYRAQRLLCITVLIFCLIEYALWTASCFWWGDTMANPYYWIDLVWTFSLPLFLPATRKAVAA